MNPSYKTDQLGPTAELGGARSNVEVLPDCVPHEDEDMDDSQDRNDTHAQPQAAGEPVPGGRSGEGAASAMEQVIADSRRHQREQPVADGEGGSHPQ